MLLFHLQVQGFVQVKLQPCSVRHSSICERFTFVICVGNLGSVYKPVYLSSKSSPNHLWYTPPPPPQPAPFSVTGTTSPTYIPTLYLSCQGCKGRVLQRCLSGYKALELSLATESLASSFRQTEALRGSELAWRCRQAWPTRPWDDPYKTLPLAFWSSMINLWSDPLDPETGGGGWRWSSLKGY